MVRTQPQLSAEESKKLHETGRATRRFRRRGAFLLLCRVSVFIGAVRVTAQGLPGLIPQSIGPSEMAHLGNAVLLFSSDSGASTMWRSDGTVSGTRKIRQLNGYTSARIVKQSSEEVFFVTGFVSQYSSGGGESYLTLWITDGTEDGTAELVTGSAPYYSSNVRQGIRQPDPGSCGFSVIGDSSPFFFVKSQTGLDGSFPRSQLYSYRRNDGSPRLIYEAHGMNHIPLLTVDEGRLYFSIGNEIWTSDGEAAVKLLEYRRRPSFPYGTEELQVGDKLFHTTADSAHGTELWLRRNGTDSMLKDINPGINSSDPCCFAQYGGLLFFSASTLEHGRELWISDGTEAGTEMLLDIMIGKEDSSPDSFARLDEGLLFVTADSRLWKTDGTTEGTVMVSPSLTQSAEYSKTSPELNGSYVFSANPTGTAFGYELYKGNRNKITLIKDINAGGGGSDPYSLTKVGSSVFFFADDGIHGRELWITDGTGSGTRMVKDINTGSPGTDVRETTVFHDRLCFVAVSGGQEQGLYLSDGTEAGTFPVAKHPPGSTITALTPVNENLFYLVLTQKQTEHRDGTLVTVEACTATELWKSDATSSGTLALMAWQRSDFDSYELSDPLDSDDEDHQIP